MYNLIFGGGYISRFHIFYSLSNGFIPLVVEPDLYKRQFLNHLYPNAVTYASFEDIQPPLIQQVSLTSILVPPSIRSLLPLDSLPQSYVLVEKPICPHSLEKLNPNQTFLCLNLSYSTSSCKIRKSLPDISFLYSFRPNPGFSLRQASLRDYLFDFLPHVLTPLHTNYFHFNPTILYDTISDKLILGRYNLPSTSIPWSLSISADRTGTFLCQSGHHFSLDDGFTRLNSSAQPNPVISTIDKISARRGYNTLFFLYSDLKNLISHNTVSPILNSISFTNTGYLCHE